MRIARYALGMDLSLICLDQEEVCRHWVPFASRPAFFLPGGFDSALVGGVHRFHLRTPECELHTQIRIFWLAPLGVMDPFQPGIGVSVILDHPELKQMAARISQQDSHPLGASLLQSAPEDFYDRFALPSRLY